MTRGTLLRTLADSLEAQARILRSEADAIEAADSSSLLTAQEAADRIGVHLSTMHRMLAAGDIAGIKPRGRWRVPVSAIADYLATLDDPHSTRPALTAVDRGRSE